MAAMNDTFGAVLIGVIFAAILYGLTFVQTWYYFSHYTLDPWWVKLLVATVLVTDTCHQALITHTIYVTLITNFGMPSQLDNIIWSSLVEIYFNTFTTFFVQCYMAWRIYKLSNRSLLALGSVMAFVIAGLIMSFIYAAKATRFETYSQLASLKDLSMSINGVAVVGDIYIALSLCYLLQRSRTGFRRSDTMINKLIVFTINTGLLTSFFALCALAATALWPYSFIYVAFYYNIGRLYCNALLATLNARKYMRGEYSDDDTNVSLSLPGYNVQKTNPTVTGNSSKRMAGGIAIKVDTLKECVQDGHPL